MATVIDAHQHFWQYSEAEYGWIGPEMAALQRDFMPSYLQLEMRGAGVHGSVAVQARQSLTETEWLLELAERNEFIRGVVGWAPLVDAQLPQVLKGLLERRALKGLRHVIQDEPDNNFILRKDFNRGVAALLDTGLVYDILIHERHLPQAAVFAGHHPQQKFVLDHLAKPLIRNDVRESVLEPWRENLHRLAEHGNVYCKLSGLVTEASWTTWTLDDLRPYLDTALAAFGAERLMAGSDWPVCLVASTYRRWWSTLETWCGGLGPQERERILGGTAIEVYGLGQKDLPIAAAA